MSQNGELLAVKKAVKRKKTEQDSHGSAERKKKKLKIENVSDKSKKIVTGTNRSQRKGDSTDSGKASRKFDKTTKKQQKTNDSEKKKPTKMSFGDAKKSKFSLKTEASAGKKAGKKANKSEVGKNKTDEMKFKDRKKLRRQKKNVNFEVALKLKNIWEELRKADLKPDRRKACCDDLFNLVHGKASALLFAHDTSRVFQTLLKYGTAEHKAALFEELKEHLIEIMKSKYAKFFVRKLLKYGTKEQRDFIFIAIQGQVTTLVRHREAVSVVEYAYNNFANATQRAAIAGGFYGPAFTIFKSPEEKTLQKFVEAHPERRDEVIKFMKQSLSPLVDKSVLQHSFVHRLFSDFFACASEEQRAEMVETLHESVVHMLHTHDGANVAMMCLWHGTAKIRKTIIKSFKSYVVKICKEEFGHMVMLGLFDAVDDTRIVQKIILDEMIQSIDELAEDRYGRKVLLYLLMPRDPVHFHPDVVAVLQRGDNNKHSKKDTSLRQSELRSYISAPLVKFVSENCRQLVTDVDTQSLVMSTIKYSTHDPSAAMRSLAQVAAEPFVSVSDKNDVSFHHIVDHQNGHYLLKRLIVNDAERLKAGNSVSFAEILVNTVQASDLQQWSSCNRGCFVLVSLLELNHPPVSQVVRKHLVPVTSTLKTLPFKGAQILLKKLTE